MTFWLRGKKPNQNKKTEFYKAKLSHIKWTQVQTPIGPTVTAGRETRRWCISCGAPWGPILALLQPDIWPAARRHRKNIIGKVSKWHKPEGLATGSASSGAGHQAARTSTGTRPAGHGALPWQAGTGRHKGQDLSHPADQGTARMPGLRPRPNKFRPECCSFVCFTARAISY